LIAGIVAAYSAGTFNLLEAVQPSHRGWNSQNRLASDRSPDSRVVELEHPSQNETQVGKIALLSAITVAGQWRNLTAFPYIRPSTYSLIDRTSQASPNQNFLIFVMRDVG